MLTLCTVIDLIKKIYNSDPINKFIFIKINLLQYFKIQ